MSAERAGMLDEELRDAAGDYEEALYLLRVEYGRLMMSKGPDLAPARADYALAVERARASGARLRHLRERARAAAAT